MVNKGASSGPLSGGILQAIPEVLLLVPYSISQPVCLLYGWHTVCHFKTLPARGFQ